MTLYFKQAFKPYFDERKTNTSSAEIRENLLVFCSETFPGLLERFSGTEQLSFVELLKLVVFSHRHNKKDSYLQNPLVSFDIVRDPMYKYSNVS